MIRRAWAAGISVWAAACGRPPGSGSAPTPEPNRETSSSPAPTVSVALAPANASAEPAPSAAAAGEPADGAVFGEPALPRHPNDLGWLTRMVETLSNKAVTREQVTAYLGEDGGADTGRAGQRRVNARSQYLESVIIYPLPHIRIHVALDISFAKNGRPTRSTMESALGPLQSMARAPDDFQSGQKLAHYTRGAHGTVRVFVELDKTDNTQVAAVHVDVDGVKQ